MATTIKSADEFKDKISTAGKKLVVVDFYATWCGPCKEMDSHIRQLAKTFKDRAIIIKINVDKFQDICDDYKVRSMPTFVFIKNQKRLSSFAGADPEMLLKKMVSLTK